MEKYSEYTVLTVKPTKSGNGFTAGRHYKITPAPRCWHDELGPTLWHCLNDNGHERFISRDNFLDKQPSAHLWDGRNWLAAGHFVIVTEE